MTRIVATAIFGSCLMLVAFNVGRYDAAHRIALRSACDLDANQRGQLKAAWYGEAR